MLKKIASTKLAWMTAAFVLSFGCEEGAEQTFATSVRPQLDQLVLGGELGLDGSFNNKIRRGKVPRREARRLLLGAHEILKGSDFFRDRTATFVPLTAGFSKKKCDVKNKRCPGRVELVESIRQAGIDVVSLASPAIQQMGKKVLKETRKRLGQIFVCGAHESSVCRLKLGETRVAVIGISAPSDQSAEKISQHAKELVDKTRKDADVVLLSVGLDARQERDKRRRLAAAISDHARPEILLGHFDGAFDGVEVREQRLILHNPGTLLTRKEPDEMMGLAFLFRAHFSPDGLAWIEGLPVSLYRGRTRQSFLDEARIAVSRVRELSEPPGGTIKEEHGRMIIDISK